MAAFRSFLSLSIVAFLVNTVSGETHTVGEARGWSLGTDYESWASLKVFKTGDELNFTYGMFHSVLEVSKTDYDSCSTTSPLATYTDGNTVVKLSFPGMRYFICGMLGHCAVGMKVEISTVAPITDVISPVPSP